MFETSKALLDFFFYQYPGLRSLTCAADKVLQPAVRILSLDSS